jgi:hypothetical protein
VLINRARLQTRANRGVCDVASQPFDTRTLLRHSLDQRSARKSAGSQIIVTDPYCCEAELRTEVAKHLDDPIIRWEARVRSQPRRGFAKEARPWQCPLD